MHSGKRGNSEIRPAPLNSNERIFQQAATHQLLNCCCLATAPGLWLSCSPGIKTQEPVFYCLPAVMFLGDFDSRSASIFLAAACACTFPAQICSPVTFFPYNFSFTLIVESQDDVVDGLPAGLKSDTATTRLHHDGGAPGTIELRAAPAGHQALTILAGNDETAFLDRGQDDDAFRLVQQICRNAVLAVDQRVERLPGFRYPLLLVFTLLLGKCQYRHKHAEHGESDACRTNQVEELLAVLASMHGKSPSRADVPRVRYM